MMTTKIVVRKLFVSGAYYAQMGEGRGEPKIEKESNGQNHHHHLQHHPNIPVGCCQFRRRKNNVKIGNSCHVIGMVGPSPLWKKIKKIRFNNREYP